jgi:hypothetical protein
MTSRREFIQLGFAAASVPALLRASMGLPNSAPPLRTDSAIYKVIFEESSTAARRFAAEAARRGLRTHGICTDITDLYYNDLSLRWREGPVTLAGMTGKDSLFCLEMLARDRGMRLMHYAVPKEAGADPAMFSGPAMFLDRASFRPREMPLPGFSDDRKQMVSWLIAPRAIYPI